MARVGTPVDGAVEERAECGRRRASGRMVQGGQGVSAVVQVDNGDGAKSETPSLWIFPFNSANEGPFPNRDEELVLPWRVPPYNLWVGGE